MARATGRSTATRNHRARAEPASGGFEPSWFPEQSFDDVRREINDRRQQADSWPQTGSETGSEGYRHLINSRRYGSELELRWRDANRDRDSTRKLSVSTTYLLAAFMAVIAGGGAGYAASKYEAIKYHVTAFLTPPAATAEAIPVTASDPGPVDETTISKKPVAIATLTVADSRGVLNSHIPLMLTAEPSVPGQDLILRISGVPKSAYLTAGTREADSDWHLPASATKDLKLVVSAVPRGDLELAVAAVEPKTGELMSPVKQVTVTVETAGVKVTPTSAPPISARTAPQSQVAGLPAAIPPPDSPTFDAATVRDKLNKAESALQAGAFIEARVLFESAYNMGSADGAMGIARTFDPLTQTGTGKTSPDANAALALEWYSRATASGKIREEARAAMSRLSVASRAD